MSNALTVVLRSLLVMVFSLSAVSAKAELKVGDMAPNFTLQASDGETYDLADYRGKQAVVLAWFPRAFTSGCTVECKSLAENGDEIRKFDVSYFMASTDPVDKNAAFADETKADFPLLSDPDGEVAKAYGVFTRGFARRYTFYIDVDGVITHIDTAVKPSSSAEDMIANLENLGVAQRDS
ncbi:peroxiredoxin [Congregibacter litoralis]|uniref:thioredoxin-dependent peroxiredoxin n=1 Tax=Congregibacter litoralis KT71 TaxID=314285 RepID=A4A3P6_9GAMM|nr:peroxiredoxin [Congregibacter litoralis]EAQ99319.1 Peroxiredoxin [Congregibacter litoralis KT71]